METSFAVDWLSMTFHAGNEVSPYQAFAFGYSPDRWVGCKPANGYTMALKHPFGHMVMHNPDRPEMGVHLMMGGRALLEIRKQGISGLSIVKWAVENNVNVTRIDLAIDVRGEFIDYQQWHDAPQLKGDEGRSKTRSLVTTKPRGTTLYVGSRQSEKFMRIYDKSAEQDLPVTDLWTRMELEIKGKTARKVAATIAGMKNSEVAAYTKGLMRGLYNADIPLYQAILDAQTQHVGSTKDTGHRTLEWLVGTVAKTLAKTIIELDHKPVAEEFWAAVREQMALLGSPAAD